MPDVHIWLPDDLHREVYARPDLNISAVCQEALAVAVREGCAHPRLAARGAGYVCVSCGAPLGRPVTAG